MLRYHFHKYLKTCCGQKWIPCLPKIETFNTKTRNISDHLKYTYSIVDGTNHSQCAEPPDPIIKCANYNRRPIKNCTSVYQIKLCTIISALIISRIPFAFIKGFIFSDPIDYLLCNQCEVHLSDKDTDKANELQFIWPDFIGVFYTAKTSAIMILLSLLGKLFLWNSMNGGLMRLDANFRNITILFLLQSHNQYLCIELKTHKLGMKGLNSKN